MRRVLHSLVFLPLFVVLSAWASEELEESSAVPAGSTAQTPGSVVEEVTSKVLSTARDSSELLKSDPEAYFAKIRGQLEPAVDFLSIAKNVMGKRHWLAASDTQREQFVETFTDSLVETYGKGIANFADLDITIESERPSEKSDATYYVVQAVKTDKGMSKIVYTMRLTDEGWKLRNVVLDGVNLGKTFRSQFDQAVVDAGENLDLAIASWGEQGK